jgi:hypothetical protein
MVILLHKHLVQNYFHIKLTTGISLFTTSFSFGMQLILSAIKIQSAIFILSLYHSEQSVGIYSAANSLIGMLLYPWQYPRQYFQPSQNWLFNLGQNCRISTSFVSNISSYWGFQWAWG